MIIPKLKKALGKKRCAKVANFYDDGFVVEITLPNDCWDLWEYCAGEFTFPEIVMYAKNFIDAEGVGGANDDD